MQNLKFLSKYSLIMILLVTISLEARLRFGNDYHLGGAELAITPFDFPFIFLFIGYILRTIYTSNYSIFFDKYSFLVVFFVLTQALSMLNSSQIEYSVYELIRLMKMIFLFLMIRDFIKTEGVKYILYGMLAAIFLQFLYGGLQAVLGTTEEINFFSSAEEVYEVGAINRIQGTLGHPNMLAQFINVSFVFCFFAYTAFEGKEKILFGLALFGTVLLIILTFSRTGIVVYGFIFMILYLTMRDQGGRKFFKSKNIFNRFVVPGFMFVAFVFLLEKVIERFIEAPETSTSSRYYLAIIALNMFQENPLLGVGLNNFTIVMQFYDPFGLTQFFPHPVHNIFLLIGAETGLLGLLAFLILNIVFLKGAYRVIKKGSRNKRNLMLACCCGIFAIFLSGMLGWAWRMDSIQALYWLTLGIIAGVSDRKIL